MAMNEIAIEVKNLIKRYGEGETALCGVSFAVPRGALFAYLGVNGAGKSTTINILCSVLGKTGGEVRILGLDPDRNSAEIKRKTGIVFQSSVLDERLTVRDNLATRAAFYGLRGKALKSRLRELSALLDLDPIMNKPLKNLSGGQKRRADLARGLINSPEILYLDEPTTGLDPMTRKKVWEVIENLRRERGTTVFLTTHYMEEAAKADEAVIIDRGRIVAAGAPHELKERFSGDYVVLYREQTAEFDEVLRRVGKPYRYESNAYRVRVTAVREALDLLSELGNPDDFEIVKGDMDDVFLSATGRTREEVENQ